MFDKMKYWKGIEELENSPEFVKNAFAEFPDFLPVKEGRAGLPEDDTTAPRRDFLKLMGFGVAAATLAACETPVHKAIPYLNKPEEVDPTISNFYASTYFNGSDYNAVLVKTRDGRPIKLEGNPESPITRGGLSARAQAAVLNLYDGARLQQFAIKGQPAKTADVDRAVRAGLANAQGKVVVVSPTIISPSTKRAIAAFAGRYRNVEHVMYDVNSASGLLQANGGVLPSYDFSRANVIVSLGADFLGTWISPVEYARQYVATRKVSTDKRTMSRHYQFETALSLSGANADVRVPVKPSQLGTVALALYGAVSGGGANAGLSKEQQQEVSNAAKELLANRGASLVVSGSNDPNVQAVVAGWNDFEPKRGSLSLAQPAIMPLFKTRQAQESLLRWAGSNESYYNFLRDGWRQVLGAGDFQASWDKAVHDGVASGTALTPAAYTGRTVGAADGAAALRSTSAKQGIEVALYEKVGVGDGGVEGNNPFLHELPDPISKATWGNYLAIPYSMAVAQKWEQGDVIKVTAAGQSIEVPVLVQPGQAEGTVAIAVGYGRAKTGKVGDNLGANAFPLAQVIGGAVQYTNVVTLEPTGAKNPIAQTQTHHTLMDRREVVQVNTLEKYRENPKEVTEYEKVYTPEGLEKPNKVSLWQDYQYNDHHWGMAIDLNSCIGCGSCVIGCQAENNVAVVGKQQVINRREMHWIRIDRYYSSDTHKDSFDTEGKITTYRKMEDPSANPQVIFQPLMCQQCNHAPCETVCPVLATTHSSEGLNQMTYNRCIGTRYCANNCPYKVRRFNWFSYYSNEKFEDVNGHMFTDLGRMVLNPDVTVRARGVMEKCSFCVQRIQLGKLEAKKQKRRPKDGEIVTACAQSCPTEAILFGDMRDPSSRISQLLRREDGERAFHALDSINVQPNVTYLTKIRNSVSTMFGPEEGEEVEEKQPAANQPV
ncbi:MAG: 4Fe-4S dicluster domain-containing protein [Hymenobacter sp.]|nr:MAG: 4Fe-4S dicluster domain-containing protein [Hymenobacter sp.]